MHWDKRKQTSIWQYEHGGFFGKEEEFRSSWKKWTRLIGDEKVLNTSFTCVKFSIINKSVFYIIREDFELKEKKGSNPKGEEI